MNDYYTPAAQRKRERYRRLREIDPDTYRRCAATASAIESKHDLPVSATASIEDSMMALALDLLERMEATP